MNGLQVGMRIAETAKNPNTVLNAVKKVAAKAPNTAETMNLLAKSMRFSGLSENEQQMMGAAIDLMG